MMSSVPPQLANAVFTLTSSFSSPERKMSAMYTIAGLFHGVLTTQMKDYQAFMIEMDIVDSLLSIVSHVDTPERVRGLSFVILRLVSFQNHQLDHELATNQCLLDAITTQLSDDFASDIVKIHVVSLIQTIASDFETHYSLMRFIPLVLPLLSSEQTRNDLKSAAVKLIGNMAYNPDSHPDLIRMGVVSPLEAIILSDSKAVWQLSAGLTLACLLEPSHPTLARMPDTILKDTVGALEASLLGEDYPSGLQNVF